MTQVFYSKLSKILKAIIKHLRMTASKFIGNSIWRTPPPKNTDQNILQVFNIYVIVLKNDIDY